MIKGLQTKWGTCSRTVSFDSTPYTLACWNNLIAAGFSSGNVIILDVIIGTHMSILSGHTGCVNSLAFSLDGKFLVSGSDDNAVHLWDVQTGGIIKAFYGHSDPVYPVSISMDHNMIASGSWDKTIRLWNIQTGDCCCIIDKHDGHVSSVIFSPTNSQLLISASGDQTIQQWSTNGHQIGPPYGGNYVAFSSDGTHFVGWGGGVATIQSTVSGGVISTIHAPNGDFQCCCFSPNGELMAGSSGNTAYIWDITGLEPCLIETCIGHTGSITSLVFSSSLISSSNDRSIKFWQGALLTAPVVTDLEPIPPTPASVTFIGLYEKCGVVVSSDKAGVVRTWDILTGLCKAFFYTSVGPLNQRDMDMVDNRLIITWYTTHTEEMYSHWAPTTYRYKSRIHIWDTRTENYPKKTDIVSKFQPISLRISGDGSKVFLLEEMHIKAFSTWTGEVVKKVTFEEKLLNYGRVYAVANNNLEQSSSRSDDAVATMPISTVINNPLIVDGSRVWVQTKGSPIQGWDFGTLDSAPIPLSDMPPDPNKSHLEFIHGTRRRNTPSTIRDKFTGEEVYRLPERYERFRAAQWGGRYLVAGYKSGEVLILDFAHMVTQQTHIVDTENTGVAASDI